MVIVDGVVLGNPGNATCGGVFRRYKGFVDGSFALPLGVQTPLFAEIMGFRKTGELATVKGWFPLWIEMDSTTLLYMVKAKSSEVPWRLRVRWKKCLKTHYANSFKISQIFREGDGLVDAMAKSGLTLLESDVELD